LDILEDGVPMPGTRNQTEQDIKGGLGEGKIVLGRREVRHWKWSSGISWKTIGRVTTYYNVGREKSMLNYQGIFHRAKTFSGSSFYGKQDADGL
jgi:hypothetical protein